MLIRRCVGHCQAECIDAFAKSEYSNGRAVHNYRADDQERYDWPHKIHDVVMVRARRRELI